MNNREIIHQFVNMVGRHPEAKDLAEALNEEAKIFGCLVDCDLIVRRYLTPARTITPIIAFNRYNEPFVAINNDTELFCLHKKYKLNDKILGRPITAFDVCWALNRKHNPTYYFDLKLYNFNNDSLSQCIKISAHSSKNADKEGLIYFEAMKKDGTKTFHTEWSDDTSDKIVKLINL